MHEPADEVVGDLPHREQHPHAARVPTGRALLPLLAVEAARDLGAGAGRDPGQPVDEPPPLLGQRQLAEARLGDVVAVDEQVRPRLPEQLVQQRRVVDRPPREPGRTAAGVVVGPTRSAGRSATGGRASSDRSPLAASTIVSRRSRTRTSASLRAARSSARAAVRSAWDARRSSRACRRSSSARAFASSAASWTARASSAARRPSLRARSASDRSRRSSRWSPPSCSCAARASSRAAVASARDRSTSTWARSSRARSCAASGSGTTSCTGRSSGHRGDPRSQAPAAAASDALGRLLHVRADLGRQLGVRLRPDPRDPGAERVLLQGGPERSGAGRRTTSRGEPVHGAQRRGDLGRLGRAQCVRGDLHEGRPQGGRHVDPLVGCPARAAHAQHPRRRTARRGPARTPGG